MKILIVDDEVDFTSELLSRLTKRGGHNVQTACNGAEGWELFSTAQSPFDFILTDVKMPVMDGLSLLKKVRKENYDIPVVMMTGHGDMDISIQALKLGAFDFLVKPFPIKELDVTMAKLEMFYSSQHKLHQLLPSMEQVIQITIPSRMEFITTLINFLNNHYKQLCQLFHVSSHQVDLCLYEAITNAIVHGNFQISSDLKEESWLKFDNLVKEREGNPAYSERSVVLRYWVKEQSMIFEVEDEGNGFSQDYQVDLDDPMSLLSSGRGLILIMSSMDEVSWNDKRNCIRMTKALR